MCFYQSICWLYEIFFVIIVENNLYSCTKHFAF